MILRTLVIIATVLVSSTSCSDDDSESDDEYSNWKTRNEAYLDNVRNEALTSIASAKEQYPTTWTEHCKWRTFQSYKLAPGSTLNGKNDSIYVEILTQGEGTESPFSTDSVRVYYAGRLIPTDSYPTGLIIDHSGQSNKIDVIFDHTISAPTSFLVSSLTIGFATAIQHMHIGDMWRVYIPANLAYKDTETGSIPASSTLIFDIELIQFARAGNSLPTTY